MEKRLALSCEVSSLQTLRVPDQSRQIAVTLRKWHQTVMMLHFLNLQMQ